MNPIEDHSSYNGVKIELILVLVSTAALFLSIRSQNLYIILLSSLSLVVLIIFMESRYGVIGLSAALLFLYPGSTVGWLYGFDSHATASNVLKIKETGWPVLDATYGFPQTPLLHIHTLISSEITGLEILPSTQGKLLITYLLPLLYTAIVVLTIYTCAKKFEHRILSRDTRLLPVFTILPVVLWIPLVRFHTSFRRESLGILFFTFFVFLFLQRNKMQEYRWRIILMIFTISIVISHHLSVFVLFILFISVLFWEMRKEWLDDASSRLGIMKLSFTLLSIIFVTWYIISGFATVFFAQRVSEVVGLSLIDDIFNFILASQGPQSSFSPINRNLETILTTLINEWVYQVLLASGILLLIYKQHQQQKEIDHWIGSMLVFGIFIAILSAIGWLSNSLPRSRLQSFFVVAAGWVVIFSLKQDDKDDNIPKLKMFLSLLLLTSASMIPPHMISDSNPDYEQGEFSQTFPRSVYSTGEFLKKYDQSSRLVAGFSVREVLLTSTQKPILGQHAAIRNGTVSRDSKVILSESNRYLYRGTNFERDALIAFLPDDLFVKYNSKSNKIYSTGKIRVYS